jgi:hypothetical protein
MDWWKVVLVVPAILEGLAKLVRAIGEARRRRSIRPKPEPPEPPEPEDPSRSNGSSSS